MLKHVMLHAYEPVPVQPKVGSELDWTMRRVLASLVSTLAWLGLNPYLGISWLGLNIGKTE